MMCCIRKSCIFISLCGVGIKVDVNETDAIQEGGAGEGWG